MRLQSIHIENFLGVRLVDLQHLMPVTVIAGPNGAGKSSLRDGIALALTGDLGRVTLKKEAGALVRDGADAAVCEVRCTDGDTWAATITAAGKLTSPIGKKGADADPVMPLVLDAQRFARLDATERRAFLFDLTGLKTDGKAVAGRLLARGCEQAKVERVQPLLRAGFDAAHKQARTNATEAKGAWRALTGETYGAQKAQTWQAGVPAHNAEGIPSLQTEIRHADAALATWQKTIGRLQAVEKHRAELGAKLAPLREHAAQLERIRARAAVNETELRRIDAEVAAATAATGAGPRVGLVHDIAAHLALMIDHGDRMGWFADSGDREIRGAAADLVAAYEREHGALGGGQADRATASRLPALQQAQATCRRTVANDRRDLEAAIGAGAQAEAIATELAQPFDAAELAAARAAVAEIEEHRSRAQQQLDTQAALKREADAAEAKTKQAAQHHADVLAWDAIAEALSPDGIPAEMLREALGPLRERLQQAAADTTWPLVAIADDMAITYGGRPRALCSESEQWRCDAMLAEAISHLSGTGLLVLDRFDVLDLQGREDLLIWLNVLAEAGEIGTALVLGTLKQPAPVSEFIGSVWLDNGTAGQPLRRVA